MSEAAALVSEGAGLQDIERRRKALNVSVLALCVQAEVSTRSYFYGLNGDRQLTATQIGKLRLALKRVKDNYGGNPGPLTMHACYRLALVLAASLLEVDARSVVESQPSRRATADPVWLNAARARQLAYWIAVNLLGLRVVDVALAANVTKQAVSQAVDKVNVTEADALAIARRQIEAIWS